MGIGVRFILMGIASFEEIGVTSILFSVRIKRHSAQRSLHCIRSYDSVLRTDVFQVCPVLEASNAGHHALSLKAWKFCLGLKHVRLATEGTSCEAFQSSPCSIESLQDWRKYGVAPQDDLFSWSFQQTALHQSSNCINERLLQEWIVSYGRCFSCRSDYRFQSSTQLQIWGYTDKVFEVHSEICLGLPRGSSSLPVCKQEEAGVSLGFDLLIFMISTDIKTKWCPRSARTFFGKSSAIASSF